MIDLATRGAPFDLGAVPVDVMKDAAARARFASGPTSDIARVGLGVAVRSGAPKPDIGITDAMKAKIKAQATPAKLVQAVAGGEAELGLFLLNVLTAPDLDVVGPVPAELHQQVVFTAAVARNTEAAETAISFIAYLKTPAPAAVLEAKGMIPARGGTPAAHSTFAPEPFTTAAHFGTSDLRNAPNSADE